jgi:hypothetical protein
MFAASSFKAGSVITIASLPEKTPVNDTSAATIFCNGIGSLNTSDAKNTKASFSMESLTTLLSVTF